MKFLKLAVMIFILVSTSAMTLAQDDFVNDPTVNENANACLDGGSMEGKCDIDSDGDGIASEEESAWAWNCGWYLIRLENNLIPPTQFPEDCTSLLKYQPRAFCIGGFIYYTGIPNQPRNIHFSNRGEDNCSGQRDSYGDVVIIQSDRIETAMELCTSVIGDPNYGFHIYSYPGGEEDLWLCFRVG